MDDLRLAAALASATETERAIRFHLETTESPAEIVRGKEAHRNVNGLRIALERWIDMRRFRVQHPGIDSSVGS